MGDRRVWGIATQLYSVRSARSWGVGDVADLEDLAVWGGAELGAGFVLVNPLHAAEPAAPMEPSPYLPTTRRFQNPLYLRVERIPEYADLDAAGPAHGRPAARRGARPSWTIWTGSTGTSPGRAKRAALQAGARGAAVGRAGRSPTAPTATREGVGLEDFATWCALFEEHGADWHEWPEELRHPASPAVHGVPGGERRRRRLPPLAAVGARRAARRRPRPPPLRAGMPLGVMHDLAVGVHR